MLLMLGLAQAELNADGPACPRLLPRVTPNPQKMAYHAARARLQQFATKTLASTSQGWEQASSRIAGGEMVRAHAQLATYMALLTIRTRSGQRFTCSAAVVAPRLLLTAYHCVYDADASGVTAYVGGTSKSTGVAISATGFESPFDPGGGADPQNSFWYDISLIRLAERVPTHVQFMGVSVNQSVPIEGSAVRVAGFGNVDGDSNSGKRLHQVDMPIVKGATCRKLYSRPDSHLKVNYSMQVCAGYNMRGANNKSVVCDTW